MRALLLLRFAVLIARPGRNVGSCLFDGIVVQTAEGTRFVDADQIGSIYTGYVCTTLSAEQAADLPLPDGSSLVEIKPGRSIVDRLARGFGRGQ